MRGCVSAGLATALATATLVAPSVKAHAIVDNASITIEAETNNLQLDCSHCSGGSLTGLSAGEVSGDDNGIVYSAVWPDPQAPPIESVNLTGSLDYTTTCMTSSAGSVTWTGGFDGSSSYTVTGAVLVYNHAVYRGATVTGSLFGSWTGNVAVLSTTSLTIQWSTSITISISVAEVSKGVTTMQPLPPVAPCINGNSQVYAINGQVLTTL